MYFASTSRECQQKVEKIKEQDYEVISGFGAGIPNKSFRRGPNGRGWEGGSKLKPNPQKREGGPKPN